MKTIRIIDGITYGHRVNGFISPKTKVDKPFEVTDEEADRLLTGGHAVLVGESEDKIILPPDSNPENGENTLSEGVNSSDEESAENGEEMSENDMDEEEEGFTREFLSAFTVSTLKGIAEDLNVYSSELRNKDSLINAILPVCPEVPFEAEVLSKFSKPTLKEMAENLKVYNSEMRSKDALIAAILPMFSTDELTEESENEDFVI